MKNILPTTLAAFALSASAVVADSYQTGLSQLNIRDTSGDRHLQGFLWYPTEQTDGATPAHGNAVWEPIKVHPDADPVNAKHPLVVLSHGMYGNARNQAWLASHLTQQGYVVAAIDHPGTSTFQRNPDHARELWERPKDISRTIDHILADSAYSDIVDTDSIYMAGHSLGGFTAVALAGGVFDSSKFDAFCNSDKADIACNVLSKWNVAKSQEDRVTISLDYSDNRIKAFAVFDLGGTQSFSSESLEAIETPMLVIGAPTGAQALNLDVESRALTASLPKQSVTYIEPSDLAHFDFLGECTEKALDILKEEEPDDVFVCENGTQARAQKHNHIASKVIAFFSSS